MNTARLVAPVGVLAVVLLLVAAQASNGAQTSASRPRIMSKPIPYGHKRKAEMAAYALRHYGINTWRLTNPHVIVEHYTASSTFSSAYWGFFSNSPDRELGELPGDCAHFIIDTDGTIYQLVPLSVMCRHTVGLNYTAIGIEHVGTSDQQILDNPAQMRSSLALTVWLMSRFHVRLGNVIGHNESLTSPFHHELYPAWRCQTHGDWTLADMDVYRARLQRALALLQVPAGLPTRRATPRC